MERRNLYRILHVQPEAPVEVIKAAYRALMSTMRMHPDLGGDTAVAARLNAAYATLSDPASRRAYDLSLRRPARGGSGGSGASTPGTAAGRAAPAAPGRPATLSPASWMADRRCPFCNHRFTSKPARHERCGACDSPLAAAPVGAGVGDAGELIGRRRASRVDRSMQGWLRRPGLAGEQAIQLRDLSLSGLSFTSPMAVATGSAVRVVTPMFDSVAQVVGCHAQAGRHVVHAQLLTLQLVRDGKGMFVSVKV